MAMYNYFQQNPQGSMNPWMMKEMDMDWPWWQMMQGGQGASAPGIRGQASSPQVNPAMMQAFLRSDVGKDLMDNDLVQTWMVAKQMQGQQGASHSIRGKPQGFTDLFSGFGQQQPSTPTTTPMFYPGMDEEMMQWQMMQQNPGSYNPLMADWDIKDWTRFNMMNQGSQNPSTNAAAAAMFTDGDMSDYMMWQSIMNSQQQQQQSSSRPGPRGSAVKEMQKMALCQTYLQSATGDQAQQMQAYMMYSQAEDIGEDDIRSCLMMQQMQASMAPAPAAPSTGFNFGGGFGPRALPDGKDIAMAAWMNKQQGEGQGLNYYPGMDSEDMLEYSFWQKMKDQVAAKKQQQ